MKKFYLAAFISFTALLPCTVSAAIKNVNFTWTMSDTTDVIGYKIYYSYNENMTISDSTLHSDCTVPSYTLSVANAPDLDYSMTCNNVIIDQYRAYFRIAAVTAEKEVESDTFLVLGDIPKVQYFSEITSEGSPGSLSAINFQPSNAPVPSGFLADSGESYNATLGYGWTQPPASLGGRDRENSASPDQTYDTLLHVKPEAIWEMEINNGSYRVTICLGDPSYPIGTPNVQTEGNTIISGQTLSTSNPWIEESADIQVTDGRLTITFTGSTDPARICWIKIDSL